MGVAYTWTKPLRPGVGGKIPTSLILSHFIVFLQTATNISLRNLSRRWGNVEHVTMAEQEWFHTWREVVQDLVGRDPSRRQSRLAGAWRRSIPAPSQD